MEHKNAVKVFFKNSNDLEFNILVEDYIKKREFTCQMQHDTV